MTTKSESHKQLHKRASLTASLADSLSAPWQAVVAPFGADRLCLRSSLELGWVPTIQINGTEISANGQEFETHEKFWLTFRSALKLNERKTLREQWHVQEVFKSGALADFASSSKHVGVVSHAGVDAGLEKDAVRYELDDGLLLRVHHCQLLIYPSLDSPGAVALTCCAGDIEKYIADADVTWVA